MRRPGIRRECQKEPAETVQSSDTDASLGAFPWKVIFGVTPGWTQNWLDRFHSSSCLRIDTGEGHLEYPTLPAANPTKENSWREQWVNFWTDSPFNKLQDVAV